MTARTVPVRKPGPGARIVSSRSLSVLGAGSALLALDSRLLAIGDDAWTCAWVDPATGAEEPWLLAGSGARLEKRLKPDFEAAAVASDGAVWLFGSGSLSNRTSLVRLVEGTVTVLDGTELYAALASVIGGPPNIEGALFSWPAKCEAIAGVSSGPRLHASSGLVLLHRATGSDPDLLLDVSAAALVGGRPVVTLMAEIEPVELAGIPAHLTDLALDDQGRIAFLAAAEDTDDPVLDGAVTGALFGVLEGPEARWTPLLEADGSVSVRKPEGLVIDADGGWLVTDRDDPALPAELCRFTL